MEPLLLALLQADLIWENKKANLVNFEKEIEARDRMKEEKGLQVLTHS